MNNSYWTIKRTIVVAFICLLILISPAQAATWHVSQHVTSGTGSGNSWPNAMASLVDALANPQFQLGDTILVGQGTYHPLTGQSFKIDEFLNELKLIGGYAGWLPTGVLAADPDLRDVQANKTILSGDPAGDDGPFTGDLDYLRNLNFDDNSDIVVWVQDVTDGTRIEGFFIERAVGRIPISGTNQVLGGGMYIDNSQMDVVNCTFRYNTTGIPFEVPETQESDPGKTSDGGGATVRGGQIVADIVQYTRFINCTFHDNIAARGGALAVVDGSPTNTSTQVKVVNCLFYDNQALQISDADLFVADDSDAAIVLRKSIFRSELAFKSRHNSGTGILPVH